MTDSKDKFDLVIYQQIVVDTYLYLIKENFMLIKRLLKQKNKLRRPYYPKQKEILYKGRAKHLEIMTLLGSTAEHLVKLILVKQGFVINKSQKTKFSKSFLSELEKFNTLQQPNQRRVDTLYLHAKKEVGQYEKNTINFAKCIRKFHPSSRGKHNFIKPFIIAGTKRYLKKYRQLNRKNCLSVIRDMRNSYTHLANAQEEVQGIVWYMYNYLLCVSKKEFPKKFRGIHLIGNQNIKKLFKL